MPKTKPVVFWIENKPERDIHKQLKKRLSNKGIDLCQVKNVDRLAVKLDDVEPSDIRGFIVDMMLDGPNNLSSFDQPQIQWDHDKTDAGGIILKYILKNDGSDYIEIPTMVLSVRPDIDKENLQQYKNTEQVIKRDIVNQHWLQELIAWVDSL